MELTRRELIKASAAIAVVGATSRLSRASDGPLPSWNEGSSKKAILDFVHATTDRISANFVPPEERIATFDQEAH